MIIIEKGARRLTQASKDGEPFVCAVALGENPVGPKTREGDGKTPEGRYRICTKNPRSKFFLSLEIDYPRLRDAKTALREGRISAFTCARICLTRALLRRPPRKTPLGGYIMIHGEHPEKKAGDWTKGCVALQNEDMRALYRRCEIGEEVVIKP